jgi:tetratricopeptide (TPR) repeat protein
MTSASFAEDDEIRPIPDAAEAALSPQDTKTNDQLFLTGLHLEQYRHATWSALDYYEEALRRAVKIWQKRNPNPYDGEAIFNLALCLKYQYRLQEAYQLFWKSTWNKTWADAGYFEAACISMSEGRYEDALDEVERSSELDASFPSVWRNLALARFNKQDRQEEALAMMEKAFSLDETDSRILMELDQLYKRLLKYMQGSEFHPSSVLSESQLRRQLPELLRSEIAINCDADNAFAWRYVRLSREVHRHVFL